jgi:EmrB/QacA subfamily drug resistance transporter
MTRGPDRIQGLVLATALLGTFFSGMAARIFNISMPTVAASLETDLVGISWAFLAYQLSNIGLGLIFGRLGDLWGRAKVFGAGFAVFALGSLFCGISQTLLHLVLARLVQGIGAAMIQSCGRALAAEAVPPELAGRAQGYMTTGHHVGFLIGPTIGGLMIDYLSWRWTFLFLVPIGAVGAALALYRIETPPAGTRKGAIDYPGAVLLFATATTLVLVLDRRNLEAIGGAAKLALALAFVGSLSTLLVHERRTSNPFVNLSLFRIRLFSMSALSLAIVAMCYALMGFLLPFYLQDVLGLSPTTVGLLFATAPITTIPCAWLSGHLADRWGPRGPATIGVAFLVLSLSLGLLLRPDSHWLLPGLMLVIGGITNGIFNPANSMALIGSVPPEHRGFASGVHHVTFGIGNVLGIAAASLLMAIAFERYTGVPGARLATTDPVLFVRALNFTYLAAAAISAVALLTASTKGEIRAGGGH